MEQKRGWSGREFSMYMGKTTSVCSTYLENMQEMDDVGD
jgi:hypothetical protein